MSEPDRAPSQDSTRRRLSRRLAVLLLVVAVLPTLELARQRSRARIDIHNESLKSVGTQDARTMEERIRDFGPDRSIVVGLSWRSAQRKNEDAAEVEKLSVVLADDPITARLDRLPIASQTLTLFELALTDEASRNCESALEHVRALVREVRPTAAQPLISGQIAGEVAIARAVADEQQRVFPVVALVLAVVLFLIYRHLAIVAAALLPAAIAVVSTGGLHAVAGHAVDPLSGLLEPVLMTVAVASAIHVIEGYLGQRSRGFEPESAAVESIIDLRVPALWTTGTTIAGFLTLWTSDIPAVARFGTFASLGVVLAFVTSFTVAPAILVIAARGDRIRRLRARSEGMRAFFRRATARLYRRRGLVAVATVALSVMSGAWLPRLRADTDPLQILPRTHAFRQDLEAITAAGVSAMRFDLILDDEARPLGLLDDRVVSATLRATRVHGCLGLGGMPRRSERGSILIPLITDLRGSAGQCALLEGVELAARDAGIPRARATGTLVRVARDSEHLVTRRSAGIVVMLVVLFFVFLAAFRSVALAVMALIPNALPAMMIYGAIAALGQSLNVATAMIGSAMLGIVVDDTIHFVHRYRRAILTGVERRLAIVEALQSVGAAIGITSLALVCGFLASLTGSLSTTRDFGLLAAATIALALAADLVVLPALLMLRRPVISVERRATAVGGTAV
ncbi:MAG: MMPL family transporter [Planctomycetes bacterium]|nr:MMPL family transporter [Planctomycetota bacterium]